MLVLFSPAYFFCQGFEWRFEWSLEWRFEYVDRGISAENGAYW